MGNAFVAGPKNEASRGRDMTNEERKSEVNHSSSSNNNNNNHVCRTTCMKLEVKWFDISAFDICANSLMKNKMHLNDNSSIYKQLKITNKGIGNINIGNKRSGATKQEVDWKCQRGFTAKRKWYTTGSRVCQRQEAVEEIRPCSSVIGNLYGWRRTERVKEEEV